MVFLHWSLPEVDAEQFFAWRTNIERIGYQIYRKMLPAASTPGFLHFHAVMNPTHIRAPSRCGQPYVQNKWFVNAYLATGLH